MRLLRGPRAAFSGGTRTARKDGRVVAVVTVAADGLSVDAQAYPRADAQPVAAGPFRFGTPAEASAFVDEAIDALAHLGCDVD